MNLFSKLRKVDSPINYSVITEVPLKEIIEAAAADSNYKIGSIRTDYEIEEAKSNSSLVRHLLKRGSQYASKKDLDKETRQRIKSYLLTLGENLESEITMRQQDNRFKLHMIPRQEILLS